MAYEIESQAWMSLGLYSKPCLCSGCARQALATVVHASLYLRFRWRVRCVRRHGNCVVRTGVKRMAL